ncbi:unnamed protein product [Blepharisma stoltei]|uniref:RING-type domain-containing protein n=1 Tax=Blepharisma stoltei TaxID=1481888 RepID=A0AAU9K4L3_9CILI|nr:unnamed protein product [Blepharisma stoltei]
MSYFLCSFEGCQGNVEAKCLCKTPALMLCAEHFGKHLVNSKGNHNFEKLFYDPYRQAKIDVLLYMKSKVEDLNNLIESVIREAFSEICMLNNNLQENIGKIYKEISAFEDYMNKIMQSLENNMITTNLEYLKLPSIEAVDYAKANLQSEFLNIKCEEIISEIYKKNGWAKLAELEESLDKNKTIELELLDTKKSMYILLQESHQEYQELKQLYEESKNQEFLLQNSLKEYEELIQIYEEAKNQEIENKKKIESYEIANIVLQNAYDELSKENEDLGLRCNKFLENYGMACAKCKRKFDIKEMSAKWCGCRFCRDCKYINNMHENICQFCHKNKKMQRARSPSYI